MKRILFTPILVITLGACAADGTSLGEPTTAAVPATPQSVVATTPIVTEPASPVAATAVPANVGQIVLVEPVAPVSQRGGNAALSIGSSIVGALIPGPWGSVAGVAAGQVGSLAIANADTKSARYHVRMADGTIQTVTQADALSMTVGTPVQVLTLADGSRRLVQAGLPATPSVVPSPI